MRTLGLRVMPKMVHWAVVEGTSDEPVLLEHDKAAPPVHGNEAASLSWYRERLRFLVDKFEIDVVGIRFAETFGRQGHLDATMRRSRIEGVLLEAAHASGKGVVTGALKLIASNLGSKSAKHYLTESDLRGLDLTKLTKERREAVLVGVAALAGDGGSMKVLAEVAYERLEQIGVGQGMNSIVYRARDPQLAGIIAVKEVEKHDFGNRVDEYFAEAQAMHENRHDNIVPVHYACATSTHVCIAMPFFEKGSFASTIKAGPAPLSVVLRVGGAVLRALAQVHLAGLLHLDVKPSNVLLSDRGVPMLAEFGQARRISKTGVASLPRLYTWSIPPEAFTGVVAVASDVYQTALLLYRAANGDPHFNAQRPDAAKLRGPIEAGKFPRRDDFMPHVPQRLRTVIRKGLRVDPSERYQSATEFADALGRVACELDWHTVIEKNGALRWKASRPDQPTLIVAAEPDGSSWRTTAFTERGGQQRAKGKSLFWKNGLTWKQACTHLTETFENLR